MCCIPIYTKQLQDLTIPTVKQFCNIEPKHQAAADSKRYLHLQIFNDRLMSAKMKKYHLCFYFCIMVAVPTNVTRLGHFWSFCWNKFSFEVAKIFRNIFGLLWDDQFIRWNYCGIFPSAFWKFFAYFLFWHQAALDYLPRLLSKWRRIFFAIFCTDSSSVALFVSTELCNYLQSICIPLFCQL